MAFTPGPLSLDSYGNITDKNGRVLGKVYSQQTDDSQESRKCADGRLWTAAPDLYAACKMIVNGHGLTSSENEIIKAAILKAEKA